MQIKKANNYFQIIGGATREAEFKYTPNGKAVTVFSLALGEDANGTKKYAKCEAWNRFAGMALTIKKADMVKAEGAIRVNEYTNKNGELVKESILTVDFLDIIHFSDYPLPAQMAQEESSPYSTNDFEEIIVDESDLPF